MKKLINIKELRNSGEQKLWTPGLQLLNSNGDVDPASLGYQYAIQTTTMIRAKVLEQKFYRVPPAEFMSVVVGQGAWMEDIKTNLTYDLAGAWESGIQSVGSGNTQMANVEVGLSSKTAKILTWAKGYVYSVAELQKALASNNWNVVQSKHEALKRNWDLGVQELAFLGLKGREADFPGLLNNPDVNVDAGTTITEYISTMDATEFQAFVAAIMDVYAENANFTVMPNTFLMPMVDFLGMAKASSDSFPIVNKLTYLLDAFKLITQNPNFRILPLAYADKTRNVGRVSVGGEDRYVLYNNELETLSMDIPVDFTMTPPGSKNNFQFEGVGYGQVTGCVVYRPREVLYLDKA